MVPDNSISTAKIQDGAVTFAKISQTGIGNLLTLAQASLTSGLSTSNTSVAYTTPTATVTASSAGTVSAYVSQTQGIAVTPGQVYTARTKINAVTGARSWNAAMTFYTAGGAAIGSAYHGNALTAAGVSVSTAVAPATAATVQVSIIYGNSAGGVIGDTVTITECGFWAGAAGSWALPGAAIVNQGFYTDESVGRRLFQWDANNSRWQMTFGDTGLRDLTASITGSVQTSNPNLKLKVRRVNSRVEWKLSETAPGSGSGTLSLLTADAGFRPAGVTAEREAMSSDNTGKPISDSACEVNTTGEVYLYGVIATRLNATVAYETTNAWPTALPGSAVGSIPS